MRIAAAVLLGLICANGALAQGFAPDTAYDPVIPTLKAVVGHEPGAAITTPDEINRYLEALSKAAADRTRLVPYATSWEGRPLHYLIVGSPDRLAKLDDIRRGMQQLGSAAADAERLIPSLPVVVWLLHGIHGNEISSAEAALQEAYHVLAARGNADVDLILRETLLIIDPMENPDGRQRFVTTNLLGRAADPDPEPLSAEHDEPWPGGRSNHYLFDLNRDYFSLSQPETRGRVRTMLEWFPQIVVDLHEMGGNSTYYFAPPADPINPHLTDAQRKWLDAFGRANAAQFDRRGFAYFSREVYDSFYPGYGESWPMFHGAIGMTYEQASPRGLAFRRDDESMLTYKDAAIHHFTAAMTTAVTAAKNRERLLRDFLDFRRGTIALGQSGIREYLIPPGSDPSRAVQLAELLQLQGIQVRVADEPFSSGGRSLARGTLIVPLAQPAGRLVRNLLDPDVKMDERFLKEQDRRRRERLPDQIYDVTAWSLPLVFDLDVIASDRVSAARSSEFKSAAAAGLALTNDAVGVLVPWGTGGAHAIADALRRGIRVNFADEPFTHGGRRFPIGTAFIRLADNPQLAPQTLSALAAEHRAEMIPIRETWTDEGISLGSGRVARLRSPRILLAWDTPASSLSAGWARFVLERHLGARVTAIRASTLQNFDMKNYDVLVLPSGTYAFNDDAVRRLRDWIRNGGTLVTIGEASRWAARDRNALLSTDTLLRDGTAERDEGSTGSGNTGSGSTGSGSTGSGSTGSGSTGSGSGGSGSAGSGSAGSGGAGSASKPFDYEKAIQPDRERPETLAGAVLRVKLDRNHWLTAGLDDEIQAVVEGNRVFAPLKLDAGRNVGVYETGDKLVAAGLVWKEAQPLLAQRAFLMHQPVGRGHIIAFAEDPNYRAFTAATELLFVNAVLLAPAH